MSLPADYHMHTPLCHHAVGEPTEYAAQAVKFGLEVDYLPGHEDWIRELAGLTIPRFEATLFAF